MFAVILAGGAGTRLRPLTYARRKELVPLLNRPLLEYRLLNLRSHGIEDIVIACAAGVREIEAHFGDGAGLGVRLNYHYERQRLGSGRAVKEAARYVGATGALVVCNGDILTNLDLTSMLQQHAATGAALSMSLASVDDPWHYGVARVDDDLRILAFVEKPPEGEEPSNLINAGTWIWEPSLLERIPDDEAAAIDGYSERVLFPGLIADGERVQGFEEDLWVDVGSPERYLRATRLLLERTVAQLGEPVIQLEDATVEDSAAISGLVLLAPGTRVGALAYIDGPSVVGTASVVEDSARITASVLWERVHVGAHSDIRDSIIGAGARIGARARVSGTIIADGGIVPDGAALAPGAKVMPGETA